MESQEKSKEGYYPIAPPPPAEEEEMHLLDYLRVVLRRLWILVTFFCVTVVTATIYTFLQTPIYQAVCTISIFREEPKILTKKIEKILPFRAWGQEDLIRTECAVIKSRAVATRVIKRLNLDLHPEFAEGTPSIPGREINPPKEGSSPYHPLAMAILGRLEVDPTRLSQIVKIKFQSKYPRLSAQVANAFAEEYIQQDLEKQAFLSGDVSVDLSLQLVEYKDKLEKSEKKLYAYAKEHNVVDLGEKENLFTRKIIAMDNQLSKAVADRIKAESRYLQSQRGNPGFLPEALESSVISNLELRYAEANSEYLRELERVKPQHPEAIQLKAKLETINKALRNETQKISASIRDEYQEAVEREKNFREQLNDLFTQKQALEGKLVEYRMLKRDVDTNAQLYNHLLKRMKETALSSEVTSGTRTANIQILEKAEVPKTPYRPRKKLNILLSVIVGLTMGTGLCFFIEYLDKSVKTQEDIERRIGLVCLGAIPNIKHAPSKR
ncbi:MAG: GumC family protein [Candidatus Brocadiales bacterium]